MSVPGEADARARVEAVFAWIDLVGPAMSRRPVPSLDREARVGLLADLEEAADSHGRGALLDEARQLVRDEMLSSPLMSAIGASYGIGIRPGSTGTVDDQVARLMALEDLVSVAVAGDLIDADAAETLATPGLRLLAIPQPGQLEPHIGDPHSQREGSEDDDEPQEGKDEAANLDGDAATDDEAQAAAEEAAAAAEEQAALRQRRAAMLVGVVAIAVLIGVGGNLGWGGMALLVGAALFVAWVFA